MKVLVTGASGFIGSRLLESLLADGHQVVTAGRSRPHGLGEHEFLEVDFAQVPAAAWWQPRLQGIDVVVNAVGIFRQQGKQTFEALHTQGPSALFEACALARVGLVVQISALGADADASTDYHISKREADERLRTLPLASVIVQPSLVYSPQGASAQFFNRLAVLPLLLLPTGAASVQPVYVDDVVRGLMQLIRRMPTGKQTIAFVGPEPLRLGQYLLALRRALGIARAPWRISLPDRLCMALGALAGRIPGSLVDRDSVSMLLRGNTADAPAFTHLLGHPPRPAQAFIAADAADRLRRDAVLAWLLPVTNAAVGVVWIWTGMVSLGLYPVQASYRLLADFGLTGPLATIALYAGALFDLLLGVLTFTAKGRLRSMTLTAQLLLICSYTLLISVRIPGWWLHPFGPISKNLPMLAAIALLLALQPGPRRA